MNVMIQLSDATYASLLNGKSRIQGSIGLINTNEGNFNEHRRYASKKRTYYKRLPHGKVSVNDEGMRMHLCIRHDDWTYGPEAIRNESADASAHLTLKPPQSPSTSKTSPVA